MATQIYVEKNERWKPIKKKDGRLSIVQQTFLSILEIEFYGIDIWKFIKKI